MAEVTQEAAPPTPQLAGRWLRLGGALLDGLIMMVIILPAMFAAGVFHNMSSGVQFSIGQRAFFFVLGMVVFLIVNGYFLAKSGQTVGKKLVGTRIVRYEDGKLLPLGTVYGLRYVVPGLVQQIPFVGGLFGLADALFIFGQEKRCIHDLIAGTKVVVA